MKILILLFLIGCDSSVTQTLNPQTFYKRDIKITCDGQRYIGAAILPIKSQYKCRFTFKGDVDLFTFQTCHRHHTNDDLVGGGIFKSRKKSVEFIYKPVIGMEMDEYCPIEIGGYERDRGRHSWGFMDIATSNEKLPASVRCNGRKKTYSGVSVCQALTGTLQEIRFNTPVSVSPDEHCELSESQDGNGIVFRFKMRPKRCVYAFREKKSPNRYHRMTTLGYESILIRKVM